MTEGVVQKMRNFFLFKKNMEILKSLIADYWKNIVILILIFLYLTK